MQQSLADFSIRHRSVEYQAPTIKFQALVEHSHSREECWLYRCFVFYGTLLSNYKPSETGKFLAKNIYFKNIYFQKWCKYCDYVWSYVVCSICKSVMSYMVPGTYN